MIRVHSRAQEQMKNTESSMPLPRSKAAQCCIAIVICTVSSIAGAIVGDAIAPGWPPSGTNTRKALGFGTVYGIIGGFVTGIACAFTPRAFRLPVIIGSAGVLCLAVAAVLAVIAKGNADIQKFYKPDSIFSSLHLCNLRNLWIALFLASLLSGIFGGW
jgi:hypothetical protein